MSSAAITFYIWKKDPALLERRLEIGVVEEKEKTQKIIQGFAYIGFVLILIIPALDHRFGWSNVPFSIVILGDILVVAGLYIYVLVLKENTFASATIEITTDQKVISTGPYSIVTTPYVFRRSHYVIWHSSCTWLVVGFDCADSIRVCSCNENS